MIKHSIIASYRLEDNRVIWESAPIYGSSSRVGVFEPNKLLMISTTPVSDTLPAEECKDLRGSRKYEISNHLGNVLAVITDKRTTICSYGTTKSFYEADLISASDYYCFGSVKPGRNYTSNNGYRFGFNGKEKDQEILNDAYDFGARIYDGRLGKWMSVDKASENLGQESPYNGMGNNPILKVDRDGNWAEVSIKRFRENKQGLQIEKHWWQVWYKTVLYEKLITIHSIKVVNNDGILSDDPDYELKMQKAVENIKKGLEEGLTALDKITTTKIRDKKGNVVKDEDGIPERKEKVFKLKTIVNDIEIVNKGEYSNRDKMGRPNEIWEIFSQKTLLKRHGPINTTKYTAPHYVQINVNHVLDYDPDFKSSRVVPHEYGHVSGNMQHRRYGLHSASLTPRPNFRDIRNIHRGIYNRGFKVK